MTLSNVLIGKWMTRGQRYLMTISRRIWVTQLPNSLLSLVLPQKKPLKISSKGFHMTEVLTVIQPIMLKQGNKHSALTVVQPPLLKP